MRNDDLMLGTLVPLPAENVGRVALSPTDVWLRAGDVNTDGNITTGLQCWNTAGDVLDQYETFNGMPVYYGGDMYDLEDSDWDVCRMFCRIVKWMWLLYVRLYHMPCRTGGIRLLMIH